MTESDGIDGLALEGSGTEIEALVADMALVLDRCVWSQTMTHASLVTYLVEESYELVDAIESEDAEAMLEELGDVLWQIVFHAEIAARTDGEGFDFDDVARVAREKAERRHPHVFGGESAPTLDDVFRVWSAAKAKEKKDRTSALDGIPSQLPALALADKVLGRAARAGALPPGALRREPGVDAVGRDEESAEQSQDRSTDAVAADEAALGAELLAIVADARRRGLDAERALRGAVHRLSDRVRDAEREERRPSS